MNGQAMLLDVASEATRKVLAERRNRPTTEERKRKLALQKFQNRRMARPDISIYDAMIAGKPAFRGCDGCEKFLASAAGGNCPGHNADGNDAWDGKPAMCHSANAEHLAAVIQNYELLEATCRRCADGDAAAAGKKCAGQMVRFGRFTAEPACLRLVAD